MVEIDFSVPDVLPIPTDRARERLPINRTYTGTSAAPTRGIRVQLDWNNAMDRWTFEVALAGEGIIVERRPVTIAQEYLYRDRVWFVFVDPYHQADRVTPTNLGDTVSLWCYPGPESPGWEDWLAANRLDEKRIESEDDRAKLLY